MAKSSLQEAIEAIAQKSGAKVFSYRNNECLKQLWQIGSGAPAPALSGRVIVIDTNEACLLRTDGMGQTLSALDWAHCYTSHAIDNQLEVPVIDIVDVRHHAAGALDSDRALLKNVRYHAPGRVGGLWPLDSFLWSLAESEHAAAPLQAEAALANKRWLSSLSLASTREGFHQANNSIAPLALLLGLAKARQDSVWDQVQGCFSHEALAPDLLTRQIMLQALKWTRIAGERAPGPFGDAAILLKKARAKDEIRLLVLDDQINEGWVPVLAAYLGLRLSVPDPDPDPASGKFRERASAVHGTRRISLWCADQPWDVLATLRKAAAEPGLATATLRLTASPDPVAANGATVHEMLLLDLRLFAGESELEKNFLKEVGQTLQAITPDQDTSWLASLDQPNFSETAHYQAALGALIRLIHQVDFTYPVVVWSSTGQRRVTEQFHKYVNVYTAIEKPRFDMYFSGVSEFPGALQDALRWARNQMRARHFFGELLAQGKSDGGYQLPSESTCRYAEVFIDEDGSPVEKGQPTRGEFSVGALVAFYESEAQAQALHEEMRRPHFGKKFIGRRPIGETQPGAEKETTLGFCEKGYLPKKLRFNAAGNPGEFWVNGVNEAGRAREVVAEKLKSVLDQNDVETLFLQTCDQSFSSGVIDHNYPRMLGETLKVLFCLFLRGIPVRVYVATRQAPTQSHAMAVDLYANFGVMTDSYKKCYYSVTNHSAFLPVLDAEQYARSPDAAILLGARGVTLSSNEIAPNAYFYEWLLATKILNGLSAHLGHALPKPKEVLTEIYPVIGSTPKHAWRHLHAYADELLEPGAKEIYTQAGVVSPDAWFVHTMNSDMGSHGRPSHLLESARQWSRGEFAPAMGSFFRGVEDPEGGRLTPLEAYIAKRLGMALKARGAEVAQSAYKALLVAVQTANAN